MNKIVVSLLFLYVMVRSVSAQTSAPLLHYEKHFEKADVGKVPDDFLVLDGAFTVNEEGGNQFLELPGAPLDSYAVQFGPSASSNVTVSAAIKSTGKGRRFPTFGVGLGGVSGFRLQVSPAKKTLELYQDQTIKKSVEYEWKSGDWLVLRLQIASADGKGRVEGKVWQKGSPEPKSWQLSVDITETPTSGRPSVFGSPFAGTPIQFDDFIVDSAH
jgi:hypothetical protein